MKDLLEAFKAKDRAAVVRALQSELDSSREWLQEHGEWALLVGILSGIIFVLFFKVIILLVVLGGLASYVIWQLTLDNPTAHYSEEFSVDPTFPSESATRTAAEPVSEPKKEKDVVVAVEPETEHKNGASGAHSDDDQKIL